LILIGLISVKSQELGYINDPDGYTNLRLGQSSKSDITGIILSGQEFKYYPDENNSWWKVEFKFRTGYIHESRIKNTNEIKSEISNFIEEFYLNGKTNIEGKESNNEKLFLYTENYPLAISMAFCELKNEIKEFLISEYKSPIHDLINIQLIYTRLISTDSYCNEIHEIIEALKIAATKVNIELNEKKTFINNIPDYNKPVENKGTINKWFDPTINGKPITYYLNHPEIDTYSKMFYQGQFRLSDCEITFSMLNKVLTDNDEIRPFYVYILNSTITISDGALSESLGSDCKNYLEKYPCEFLSIRKNPKYQENYESLLDYVAIEYFFEEEPTESINELYENISYECNVDKKEIDYLKSQIIETIERNK